MFQVFKRTQQGWLFDSALGSDQGFDSAERARKETGATYPESMLMMVRAQGVHLEIVAVRNVEQAEWTFLAKTQQG